MIGYEDAYSITITKTIWKREVFETLKKVGDELVFLLPFNPYIHRMINVGTANNIK